MKVLPFLCISSNFRNTSNGGRAAQRHSLPFCIWHLSSTAPSCAHGGALSPLDPRVNLPSELRVQLRNWKDYTALRSVSLRLNCSIFSGFLETNTYEYLLIISKGYFKRATRLWQVKLNVLNCIVFNRNRKCMFDTSSASLSATIYSASIISTVICWLFIYKHHHTL